MTSSSSQKRHRAPNLNDPREYRAALIASLEAKAGIARARGEHDSREAAKAVEYEQRLIELKAV